MTVPLAIKVTAYDSWATWGWGPALATRVIHSAQQLGALTKQFGPCPLTCTDKSGKCVSIQNAKLALLASQQEDITEGKRVRIVAEPHGGWDGSTLYDYVLRRLPDGKFLTIDGKWTSNRRNKKVKVWMFHDEVEELTRLLQMQVVG